MRPRRHRVTFFLEIRRLSGTNLSLLQTLMLSSIQIVVCDQCLVQVISFPTFDKPALAAICLFATRGHWLPFKRPKKGERGQEILLHMFNHKIHVQHISEFVNVLWMRFYLKQPQ